MLTAALPWRLGEMAALASACVLDGVRSKFFHLIGKMESKQSRFQSSGFVPDVAESTNIF